MRDFNKVSPILWQSTRFQGLPSDDGRFLFLYLLTCPHNNSAGCYWLPDGYACHDLRWDQDRYDAALQSLIEAGIVDHDSENQVVLIERWFRHNPSMNRSHYKGIIGQLEKVPSDRLCTKAFAALEAAENGTDARKIDGGTRPPDKPGARAAPSAGVTEALLNTAYMTKERRQ